MASGCPSWLAVYDQTRKCGLRARSRACPDCRTTTYGPVAGTKRLDTPEGTPAGTASANGSASLIRKSGSGVLRWQAIVPAASSTTIPRVRSCRALRRSHDRVVELGEGVRPLQADRTLEPAPESLARTVAPLEYS